MNGLSNDLRKYEQDVLSNEHAVHVTGTEEQAKCEKWKIIRKFIITATSFGNFAKNPKEFIQKFWYGSPDLKNQYVKWGITNEANAIKSYEKKFGKTTSNGIFISKRWPFLGASPDAIGQDCLVEIKCPFVTKDTTPGDHSSLTAAQKRDYCLEKVGRKFGLKTKHPYYR